MWRYFLTSKSPENVSSVICSYELFRMLLWWEFCCWKHRLPTVFYEYWNAFLLQHRQLRELLSELWDNKVCLLSVGIDVLETESLIWLPFPALNTASVQAFSSLFYASVDKIILRSALGSLSLKTLFGGKQESILNQL